VLSFGYPGMNRDVERNGMARIAVVADDADVAMLLGEALEDTGHSVAACVRPDDAMAWLREHPADLVLVDVWLRTPQEGWDLITKLREDPATSSIPVIVCSDDTWHDRVAKLLPPSNLPVLHKPFDLEELDDVVGHALTGDRQA
jgi:DNA-binding NtrC family response regulator